MAWNCSFHDQELRRSYSPYPDQLHQQRPDVTLGGRHREVR